MAGSPASIHTHYSRPYDLPTGLLFVGQMLLWLPYFRFL